MLHLLLALFLALPLGALAEQRTTTPSGALNMVLQPPKSSSMSETPNAIPDQNPSLPTMPPQIILEDPDIKKAFVQAMQRHYAYREHGYEYRERVFEWQLWSSRIIFWTVLAIVLMGLTLAAMQFLVAWTEARKSSAARAAASVRETTGQDHPEKIEFVRLMTQIEVSANGIVVNSSVVGLMILALSLIFFYLYLLIVYPINNVF